MRVWELIELVKVGVWKINLEADIPTIKWGIVLKNKSVFPIMLDGDIKGHLSFDGTKLFEQRIPLTNDLENLRHLQEGEITFEQRLSPLTTNLIKKNPNGKFSFQGLSLYFKGSEGSIKLSLVNFISPMVFWWS